MNNNYREDLTHFRIQQLITRAAQYDFRDDNYR